MAHISVLEQEVIQYLDPRPGENFIDGTGGGGGHTLAIFKNIGEKGRVLCIDLDGGALSRVKERVAAVDKLLLDRLILVNDNFANLKEIVRQNNFGPVSGILIDIGMSFDQLAESGRGFSFLKNEPLDMRFSEKQQLTVMEIINQWPQSELEKILNDYGQKRFARKISQQIIHRRKIKPIIKTQDLVSVIAQAISKKQQYGRIHFATRTFQALRIAANQELENLERFLPQAVEILTKGGRLAIISFHSLEDRIVKIFFKEEARQGIIKILTKKPIIASFEERQRNPRSRSAKLRAAQKL